MRRLIAMTTALFMLGAVAIESGGAQETSVPPYGDRDGSVTALNILPPGQGRYQNGAEALAGTEWEHNADQIALYEKLVQGALTTEQQMNVIDQQHVPATDVPRLLR